MVKVENKLQYWRLKLGYKFAKEFADYADVPYVSYIQWENNTNQIPLDKLIKIWLKIKEKYPEINIQDLLQLKDE